MTTELRPLRWVGSSKKDLGAMPEGVQDVFGYALHLAQEGGQHADAKVLKGFGGAGVLEVVEDDSDGTWRAVYTVKFSTAVYVLHVFQKKSKAGIKTPKKELELIKLRLKAAEMDHQNEEKKHEDAKNQRERSGGTGQ